LKIFSFLLGLIEIICIILPTSISSLPTRFTIFLSGLVAATKVQNEPNKGLHVIHWSVESAYDNF
jgi:hypothetical protein